MLWDHPKWRPLVQFALEPSTFSPSWAYVTHKYGQERGLVPRAYPRVILISLIFEAVRADG